MTYTFASAAFAVALLGSTAFANAEPRHHDTMGGPHVGEFRGDHRGHAFRGAERFREPVFHGDRDAWRGGHWRHDWHGGRFGWWWVVGDFWAFYPEPIYPYPDYTYDEPPPVVAGGTWYYCARPEGYYPYVRYCDMPWQTVPAEPPR